MESNCPDETLRMCRMMRICTLLRMIEGPFSLDAAYIILFLLTVIRLVCNNHVLDNVVVFSCNKCLSNNVRKRTFRHVRPAKIQISLRIRTVWSESSLGVFLIARNVKFLHARMSRLIRSSLGARVRRYVFSHSNLLCAITFFFNVFIIHYVRFTSITYSSRCTLYFRVKVLILVNIGPRKRQYSPTAIIAINILRHF